MFNVACSAKLWGKAQALNQLEITLLALIPSDGQASGLLRYYGNSFADKEIKFLCILSPVVCPHSGIWCMCLLPS